MICFRIRDARAVLWCIFFFTSGDRFLYACNDKLGKIEKKMVQDGRVEVDIGTFGGLIGEEAFYLQQKY